MIGAISAFVDSIDSHIILRMIRESKMISKEFNSSFLLENKVRMNCRDIDFNIVLIRELMLLSRHINFISSSNR